MAIVCLGAHCRLVIKGDPFVVAAVGAIPILVDNALVVAYFHGDGTCCLLYTSKRSAAKVWGRKKDSAPGMSRILPLGHSPYSGSPSSSRSSFARQPAKVFDRSYREPFYDINSRVERRRCRFQQRTGIPYPLIMN